MPSLGVLTNVIPTREDAYNVGPLIDEHQACPGNRFQNPVGNPSASPRAQKAQVPLCFADRISGTSKGTLTKGMLYLRQLVRLRATTYKIGGT